MGWSERRSLGVMLMVLPVQKSERLGIWYYTIGWRCQILNCIENFRFVYSSGFDRPAGTVSNQIKGRDWTEYFSLGIQNGPVKRLNQNSTHLCRNQKDKASDITQSEDVVKFWIALKTSVSFTRQVLTVQPVQFPIKLRVGTGLNISHWESKMALSKGWTKIQLTYEKRQGWNESIHRSLI